MPALHALSASAYISASASNVFAFLSDPHQHHVLDGSGSVAGCVEAPEPLAVGSVFAMRMRLNGVSYRTHNEVVPTRQATVREARQRPVRVPDPLSMLRKPP
jgi:hypothetical protein